MSIRSFSKTCIINYLIQYGVILHEKRYPTSYGLDGFIELLKTSNPFGKLQYRLDKEERTLHINQIQINSKNKPDIPIKLSKILFLYLLSTSNKEYIDKVTLTASPGGINSKKGTEFCLMCFYQTLGFEPANYDTKDMIKKCLKKLGKEYRKFPEMCILCECQKNKVIFTDVDLSVLQVDMKVLMPNIKKSLYEVYDQLHCE